MGILEWGFHFNPIFEPLDKFKTSCLELCYSKQSVQTNIWSMGNWHLPGTEPRKPISGSKSLKPCIQLDLINRNKKSLAILLTIQISSPIQPP